MALIPETPEVYDMLTVWEHLVFVARSCRLRDGWRPAAEDLLARDPLGLLKWWKLVVLEAMDDRGPVGITLELINDGRQAILRDQGVEDGVRDVSDQPTQQPPDPIRVLENTRRTLLKLVENIDAAIAASKEPAKSR